MSAQQRTALLDDAVLRSFSSLDYSVYNAILHNLGTLAELRVADVARLAGVSNATVVRFCKKCGYAGFPAFKRAMLSTQREGLPAQRLPSVADDMRAVFDPGQGDGIVGTIDAAFELVRWADTLYFMGLGRSAGIALYGAHLFNDLGISAIPLTTFLNFAATSAHKGVVAIVISHGGETPQVNAAVRDLVGQGGEAIAVTARAQSTLGRLVDVCIAYPTSSDPSLSAARQASQAPAIYVLEQLGRMTYNEMLGDAGAPDAADSING